MRQNIFSEKIELWTTAYRYFNIFDPPPIQMSLSSLGNISGIFLNRVVTKIDGLSIFIKSLKRSFYLTTRFTFMRQNIFSEKFELWTTAYRYLNILEVRPIQMQFFLWEIFLRINVNRVVRKNELFSDLIKMLRPSILVTTWFKKMRKNISQELISITTEVAKMWVRFETPLFKPK